MGGAARAVLTKIRRFVRHPNRRARLLRLANLAELRLRRSKLLTHPPVLCLDPGPVCNLKCPCCPTGDGTSKLKRELLQPDTFHRIVANVRIDRLAHVGLYRLGEPLLNPYLNEFVRYFTERRIFTTLSVNFSAADYDEAFLETFIQTGLDEITVCVDGMTQETYAKYRVGGNLGRVLANLKRLASTKRRLRSKTPRIVFKMLLNRFNQHETADAQRLAAEVGADFYQPHFFWTPEGAEDEWTSDAFRETYKNTPQTYVKTDERHTYIDTECRQMWDTLHVNANGDIYPCCFAVEPRFALGNLVSRHIDELWNDPRVQYLRRFVADASLPPPDFTNPCAGCPHRFCTYWEKMSSE